LKNGCAIGKGFPHNARNLTSLIHTHNGHSRFTNGTKTLAIEYSADKQSKVFTAASDIAFADNQGRKSSEGYLFTRFGGPVNWKATKQRTVITSTTEAELLALTTAAKESSWWSRFFNDIKLDLEQDITIECDNS
jgi:hypothetical protein